MAEQSKIRRRADSLVADEAARREDEFRNDMLFNPEHLKRTSRGLDHLLTEFDAFLEKVAQRDATKTPALSLEGLPTCLRPDVAPGKGTSPRNRVSATATVGPGATGALRS